jgi:hypothetical protein
MKPATPNPAVLAAMFNRPAYVDPTPKPTGEASDCPRCGTPIPDQGTIVIGVRATRRWWHRRRRWSHVEVRLLGAHEVVLHECGIRP